VGQVILFALLTEPAKDDLLDIWQYIAPKDPDAAKSLRENLV
jgi:plasmid stabilization system protein ParE